MQSSTDRATVIEEVIARLRRKQENIEKVIGTLEKLLEDAKRDADSRN